MPKERPRWTEDSVSASGFLSTDPPQAACLACSCLSKVTEVLRGCLHEVASFFPAELSLEILF